jgi:hypothetical protein
LDLRNLGDPRALAQVGYFPQQSWFKPSLIYTDPYVQVGTSAVTRRVNGIKKAEPQRIALIVQLSSPAMSLGVSKNRAVTAPTMNPPMWAM